MNTNPAHELSATAELEPVIRKRGVAELYCVSARTIENWIAAGTILAPRRDPGDRPYWLRDELEAFRRGEITVDGSPSETVAAPIVGRSHGRDPLADRYRRGRRSA